METLSRSKNFTKNDLAILRISIGPERHTLVCAPEAVWHGRKHDLLALKRIAARTGRSCILVPEAAIQRQPRLNNARMIEEASGMSVSVDQRMAVLIHLIENGSSSTLLDCACAIEHHSPFSAVLHLFALGVIRLEKTPHFLPDTRVFLPDRELGVN